jgi:hypothetical protein
VGHCAISQDEQIERRALERHQLRIYLGNGGHVLDQQPSVRQKEAQCVFCPGSKKVI